MKNTFKQMVESQLNEYTTQLADSGQMAVGGTSVMEPLILGISDRTAPDYDTIMQGIDQNNQAPQSDDYDTTKKPFLFGINDRSMPKF